MGCRSTPLPFLSLTPSPLLLPTRLSDALTLPGNKLPVKPTCLRCHSIIYLSHHRVCSNVGLAEALVGKGKEMMAAFREQGDGQPLAAWGRCSMQVGIKKCGFFQTLATIQEDGREDASQSVSNAEHSCWALFGRHWLRYNIGAGSFSLAALCVWHSSASRWTHTAQKLFGIELCLCNVIVAHLGNL